MKVLFFGSLSDIAGKTEFDLNHIQSTDQLKEKLFDKHPELARHSFLIAINKKVYTGNCILKEEDVVALLPPFSGG